MSCVWLWIALIGVPAAIRPITGTETVRLSSTVEAGISSCACGRDCPQ